jgi:hypothetical protein
MQEMKLGAGFRRTLKTASARSAAKALQAPLAAQDKPMGISQPEPDLAFRATWTANWLR